MCIPFGGLRLDKRQEALSCSSSHNQCQLTFPAWNAVFQCLPFRELICLEGEDLFETFA